MLAVQRPLWQTPPPEHCWSFVQTEGFTVEPGGDEGPGGVCGDEDGLGALVG